MGAPGIGGRSREVVQILNDQSQPGPSKRPLIAHVIYQLDVGGLENGVVNLVNNLPADRYRHAIVCLKDYTDFRHRLQHDPPLFALHKQEGKDPGLYKRLWSVLRELRPDIVHTRNLATLEAQLPALLAGVKCRVHGEHGRDIEDVDGTSRKYRLLRKAFRPLVQRYVTVSRDLDTYLQDIIGIPARKVSHIHNGVDAGRFCPAPNKRAALPVHGFAASDSVVVGTVGRMEAVKDQATLARAFVRLADQVADGRGRLRLVMVGDGMLRPRVREILEEAGCADIAWLPGSRDDVPELLRAMDIFVLPSLAEGISNTILEAMASGLPVVATRVGGNGELVVEGETGYLVPRDDPQAMAEAIRRYTADPGLRKRHAANARSRVETEFNIDEMVNRYAALYDDLLKSKGYSTCVSARRRAGPRIA